MGENKEPIKRAFSSPEEQTEAAETAYQIGKKYVNKAELENGFDVEDIESIMKFKIGYVPIGNTVILKELPKEAMMLGNITFTEWSEHNKKYVVIAPGLIIKNLKKGDVVLLTRFDGQPIVVRDRMFNKVRFIEALAYDISGIYCVEEEYRARIEKIEEEERRPRLGGITLTKNGEDA